MNDPALVQPPTDSVPGWDQLIDSLRSLPARMLAELPSDLRNDPQVQQEVARLALETPKEREHILRARRAACLERPQW